MTDKRTPNEEATMEVDWLLQESYKRAVKLRGITDWGELGNGTIRTNAERDVEKYQLEIAKLILETLIEKKHEIAHKEQQEKWDERDEKFEKRQEEADKRFEQRLGIDDYDEIGFRKKDEVDDRDTSDIGKP